MNSFATDIGHYKPLRQSTKDGVSWLYAPVQTEERALLAEYAHETAHEILESYYDFFADAPFAESLKHGIVWFTCACLIMLRAGETSRGAGLEGYLCGSYAEVEGVMFNTMLVGMVLNNDGSFIRDDLPGCSTHKLYDFIGTYIHGHNQAIRQMGGQAKMWEMEMLIYHAWLKRSRHGAMMMHERDVAKNLQHDSLDR